MNQILNDGKAQQRLAALKKLIENGLPSRQVREKDANNHIHTFYSFSPYSPTMAAYKAYEAGLTSAGIMDHDTLSGANEFKSACAMLNLGCTCGVEVRARIGGEWGKINHPDQDNCIYMSAYGVPAQSIEPFNEYLAKYRTLRNVRNKAMCDKINASFSQYGISLNFKKDVLAISQANEGGTVTERHLLYALADKLENKFGRTPVLLTFLTEKLGLSLSQKQSGFLTDESNKFFLYDLLGALKSNTEFFYVNADEELPTVEEFTAKALEFGAIPTYAYLGDVGESVTGDKRAQKFEDAFLDALLLKLKSIGIKAVTYMPTRNNMEQLLRIKALCAKLGLFEISGEDVNSPRQKFMCEKLSLTEFENLITSTWALIGHESAGSADVTKGMFADDAINQYPNLQDRVSYFAQIGYNTVK